MTENPKLCFHLISALVMYERDGQPKHRHLNVLAETEVQELSKSDLGAIQRTVMQRVNIENNVSPEMIQDVVMLNICMLGRMSSEEFHGASEDPLDASALSTA